MYASLVERNGNKWISLNLKRNFVKGKLELVLLNLS